LEKKVKKLISVKLAGMILLVLFGILVVFHILILLDLLPSGMVWGGQAGNSPNSLRTLEIVSLALTILFASVVAVKVGWVKVGRSAKAVNIFLWIIFAYLLLNTAGNLASSSLAEKLIFTPLTTIAALLVLRLALEKQPDEPPNTGAPDWRGK
jgi:hypothetical protein